MLGSGNQMQCLAAPFPCPDFSPCSHKMLLHGMWVQQCSYPTIKTPWFPSPHGETVLPPRRIASASKSPQQMGATMLCEDGWSKHSCAEPKEKSAKQKEVAQRWKAPQPLTTSRKRNQLLAQGTSPISGLYSPISDVRKCFPGSKRLWYPVE